MPIEDFFGIGLVTAEKMKGKGTRSENSEDGFGNGACWS
jgi:hypothetical protein